MKISNTSTGRARDNIRGICERAYLYKGGRRKDAFFNESKRTHLPPGKGETLEAFAIRQSAERKIKGIADRAILKHWVSTGQMNLVRGYFGIKTTTTTTP